MEKIEKILIFTNHKSLYSVNKINRAKLVFEKTEDTESKSVSEGVSNNDKIFKYAEGNTFIASNKITDGNIFMVFDEISVKDFMQFIDNFDKTKVGVIWHKKGESFKINLDNFPYNKKGQHTSTGDFYPLVLEILSSDKENKFESLCKEIFYINTKLISALDFSHKCLGITDGTEAKGFTLPKEFEICTDCVNRFNDWQGKPNNNTLRALRDEMLKEAGIKF